MSLKTQERTVPPGLNSEQIRTNERTLSTFRLVVPFGEVGARRGGEHLPRPVMGRKLPKDKVGALVPLLTNRVGFLPPSRLLSPPE